MSNLFQKFKKMDIHDAQSSGVKQKVQDDIFEVRCTNFTEFYEQLIKNKEKLVNALYNQGYAPLQSIEQEFDLALDFMKTGRKETQNTKPFNFPNTCLFKLLIDYSLVPELIKSSTVFLNTLKSAAFTSYGTVVVSEAADIHSAVDEISKTFKNLRQSWGIRKILVQENIKDQFLSLLEKNLPEIDGFYQENTDIVKEFEANIQKLTEKGVKFVQGGCKDDKLKATLAFGIPMDHLSKEKLSPIIVVDTFRTSKEGISLANKEGNSEFVSIWSENVTEAFEYVKGLKVATVWINCHGILHPKCPFTIEGMKYNMTLHPQAVTLQRQKGDAPLPETSAAYQQTFFEGNFFYTVTSEKCKKLPLVVPSDTKIDDAWATDAASLYNYDYKTVVLRYGQTFAN